MISIPTSSSVCTVRVIDTTSTVHYPAKHFFTSPIESHSDLNCPAYSFLISNADKKKHILFDLGVRKDWKDGLPAPFVKGLASKGAYCEVEKDVAEILDDHPDSTLPKSKDIDAIIWSHHHFDHTGNPSLFPKGTLLIVGPGFKEAILPAYPEDQSSSIPSSYWKDRELIELDFQKDKRACSIGPFSAFDYFEDGSFYLLYTPGHAPGHISGLARVTSNTFVFMGGDSAHHGGEIRPSELLPLPDTLPMPSSKRYATSGCPGEILANLQPDSQAGKTKPFYEPSDDFCTNKEEAMQSIENIFQLDADENVIVILAHDRFLKDKIPLFPHSIASWKDNDLDTKTRWLFVDDFAGSVDATANK